ncbi:MAG TPA: ribosome silencing factor [Anaerolineaceae bacterium]|nr:ribosome silencing factor [Anaerolineaceae bacterium]HNS37189.1 ribosome silencing factor [Anaerolineaceae bacterium]HOD03664.1 ribosome silencing factor [Anaerolineaceae bacterium]
MNTLEEKKGENILLMDIHELAAFADYFVICSGTSERMLDGLADAVMEKVKEANQQKGRREGSTGDGWLVLDLGDIVIHLFSSDQRNYYRLEELWSKGKILLRVQ